MADIATITMTGRLTRDPEQPDAKNWKNPVLVSKFSLAVNGFKKDDVSFFDCEAWGKVGEIVQQYCEKGKQVAVAGTIRIDRWEDKEGNKRSKPIVNVRDVTLLGSKDDAKATEPKQEKVEVNQDDIPF
jgi:single-strand DNA-binding protein